MVELYRAVTGPGGQRDVAFLLAAAGVRPAARSRAGARPIGSRSGRAVGPRRADAGRSRQRRRARAHGDADPQRRPHVVGAVVVSEHLERGSQSRCPARDDRLRAYMQLRTFKEPIQAVYLAIFADGHAADSRQRDVARAVPRQAHHAAGAEAGRGRARDRRRPARLPARAGDERRAGLARRGVQHDGRRAADEPREARAVAPGSRAARTSRSTRGAATSRRFSSASRPASSRSTRPGASRRSTARPSGCSGSARPRSASRPRSCSRARICAPLLPLVRRDRGGASRGASCRRSRWRATTARCIWRPPPPC